MLMRKLIFLLLILLFVGCAQLTKPSSSTSKRPAAAMSVVELLDYYQRLRGASSTELQREQTLLNQQGNLLKTDAWVIQQAMLSTVARNSNDVGRILPSLDGVAKSKEPSSTPYRPLAVMLYTLLSEQKKLEEQVDKTTVQLREEQRRAEIAEEKQAALQDKLAGMIAIERSLLNRPQGKKP